MVIRTPQSPQLKRNPLRRRRLRLSVRPEESQSSACDKGPKAKTEIQLTQVDINFKPPKIKAPAGEMVTVLVSNKGQLEHTFTAPSVDCDTGFLTPGTKATVTFEMPDKAVEFYCVPHKLRMTGEIVPSLALNRARARVSVRSYLCVAT